MSESTITRYNIYGEREYAVELFINPGTTNEWFLYQKGLFGSKNVIAFGTGDTVCFENIQSIKIGLKPPPIPYHPLLNPKPEQNIKYSDLPDKLGVDMQALQAALDAENKHRHNQKPLIGWVIKSAYKIRKILTI